MRIAAIIKPAAAIATMLLAACHAMNPFAADLGRTQVGDQVARPPYMSVFSYYGYLGEAGRERSDAQPSSSLYFWLPTSSPELGVRFLSKVQASARPDAGRDVVEGAYQAHRGDPAFFDPAIEVQRCLTVLDVSDVAKPCAQWMALGNNDDSVEMPPNPEGKLTNSLVRIGTHPDDPLKSLTRGLYRVNVRAAKKTLCGGTFLLQLGAPVLLDQVVMARDTAALGQVLEAQAQHLHASPSIGQMGTQAPADGTALPLETPTPAEE